MADKTVIRVDAPRDLSTLGDDELAALQADPGASRTLLVSVVAELVRRRRERVGYALATMNGAPVPAPAPASGASAEGVDALRSETLRLGERVARLERRVAMIAWWAVALPGAWALLRRGRSGG